MNFRRSVTVLLSSKNYGPKFNPAYRANSTLLQSIDEALQFSTTNPLYVGTVNILDSVHAFTGLPWWMSIITTTFCVRSVVHLPLMVAAKRNQAKLLNLKPQLEEEQKKLADTLKHAKWVYKLSDAQFKKSAIDSRKELQNNFYMKHNVHPMKGVVVTLTQIPIWVVLSLTLRNLSGRFNDAPHEGFLTEGGPWFTNLALTDPIFALPLALGAVTLFNIHVNKKTSPAMVSLMKRDIRLERKMRLSMYLLAFAMIPLSAIQPSCITLYWLTSALFSSMLNLALATPSIRRGLGISSSASDPDIRRLFKS